MNLSEFLGVPVVVDNLYTQSATDMLSANQGYEIGLALDLRAPLVDGLIPSMYLPSYVDDVLEYADLASFPVTGEAGKIYTAIDTGFVYRWTGSIYVRIGGASDVLTTLLAGLSLLTGTAITSSDSVLVAFGKLQKQITDLPNTFSRYDASQSLNDTQKAQILTNIGAKKSFNVVTDATTAKAVALTDFKDDVDYYDVAYIRMTSSSANTVTIGTGLSSLPNGALINVRMAGTGVTTLVASGTTLNGNLVFAATNDTKSLIKVGTNEYDVIGAA